MHIFIKIQVFYDSIIPVPSWVSEHVYVDVEPDNNLVRAGPLHGALDWLKHTNKMKNTVQKLLCILFIIKQGNGKKSQYFTRKPKDIIAKAGENVSEKYSKKNLQSFFSSGSSAL